MNFLLLAAGGLSLGVALIHIFIGGPLVARPLLAAQDLQKRPKYVNYYCWHLVSICLLLMSVTYFWPALLGGSRDLAILGSVMASLFAAWGIGLRQFSRAELRLADLPQGWLFVPIAALGIWGVLG